MSKMVNCPNEVLESLCHDESWYEIIKQRNHVRIPGANPINVSSYVKDQPDSEWEILDRDGVNIHDNNVFVRDANDMPAKMLIHPSDIYVYEKNTSDVQDEALRYGVIVTSSLQPDSRPLKRVWSEWFQPGVGVGPWKKFFGKFKAKPIPSNAMVIIDRYLFSSDKPSGMDYHNGIRNVYAILDELLPNSFTEEEDYHVMLVFDDQRINKPYDKAEQDEAPLYYVLKGLKTMREKLRKARDYHVALEILTINTKCEAGKRVYQYTHDRHILSNCFVISAAHGFSALKPDISDEQNIKDGTWLDRKLSDAVWPQTFKFESIYAGIDNEDQSVDSLPVKMSESVLNALKEYIGNLEGNDNGFHYEKDGNAHVDIRNLVNRLIKA